MSMKIYPVTNYKNCNSEYMPHFQGIGFRQFPTAAFKRPKDKVFSIVRDVSNKYRSVSQKLLFYKIIYSMNKRLKNDKAIAKIKNISQFKTDIINIADIAATDEHYANILLQTIFKNLSKVKDVDLFCVMLHAAKKSSHGANLGNQDFLGEAVTAFILNENILKKSALASFIHLNNTRKLYSPIIKKFVREEPRAQLFLSA